MSPEPIGNEHAGDYCPSLSDLIFPGDLQSVYMSIQGLSVHLFMKLREVFFESIESNLAYSYLEKHGKIKL